MSDSELVIGEFQGHRVGCFMWRGKIAVLAKEIGEALGYENEGKRFIERITQEWTEDQELISGVDYEVVKGVEVAHLKRVSRLNSDSGLGQVSHAVVLFEGGIHLSTVLSRQPRARELRRCLAVEIMPKIKTTGSNGRKEALTAAEQVTRAELLNAQKVMVDAGEQVALLSEIVAVESERMKTLRGQVSYIRGKLDNIKWTPEEVSSDVFADLQNWAGEQFLKVETVHAADVKSLRNDLSELRAEFRSEISKLRAVEKSRK